MALRANLGGQLVFVFDPGRANDTGFLHSVDQWLFTIDVFATIHRPVSDEGVRVVQSAADDGVHILLLKTLAPVRVAFGPWKFLGGGSQMFLVDITDGDHVFVGNPLEMFLGAVPAGD